MTRNGEWVFLIWAAAAGLLGMAGIKMQRRICLAVSALAVPALIFAALWHEVSMADIASFLCVTAFLALSGLPGREKE